MIWIGLLAATLLPFFLSFFGTLLMRRVAPLLRLVDLPGERRLHTTVRPKGGGIAIFLGTWVPIAVLWLGGDRFAKYEGKLPPALEESLRPMVEACAAGLRQNGNLVLAVFLGSLLVLLLGLVDDLRALSPRVKLPFQAVAAAILVAFGVKVTLFIDNPLVHWALTILWVVAITNAFNLLDNMDGLSAGVAGIAAFFFFVAAVQTDQHLAAALILPFGLALAGFLVFNFPPASVFMGDAGSLFVGYMLASTTTVFAWAKADAPISKALPLFMPLLILAIPIYDTLTVLLIRFRESRPFFQGDQNHFSHRLLKLGMSQRESLVIIYLLTLTCGAAALFLKELSVANGLVAVLQVVLLLLVIGLLERAASRKQ